MYILFFWWRFSGSAVSELRMQKVVLSSISADAIKKTPCEDATEEKGGGWRGTAPLPRRGAWLGWDLLCRRGWRERSF